MQPFEQVVSEHGAVVLRVCRGLVGTDEADDVWTESMVSAMLAYPDLRPDSNVRGWLVTIAHRRGVDHLRRRARRPVSTDDVPDLGTVDDLDSVEWADAGLHQWLAALPTKQRLAVTYRYLGDMAYSDIGVLINSSEAAARRNAADGIAALRTNVGSITNAHRSSPSHRGPKS